MTGQNVCDEVKGKSNGKQHARSKLFRAASQIFRFISCHSFKNMTHHVICGCCTTLNSECYLGRGCSPFTDLQCPALYSAASKSLSLRLPRLIVTSVSQYISHEHLSHLLGTIKRIY